MKRQCVVVGGGGHAKVVIEVLRAQRACVPVAVTDPRPRGRDVLGVRIVGSDDAWPTLLKNGVKRFILGIGSVGDNRPRATLFKRAVAAGLEPVTACHPSAVVSESARLGAGTLVAPQAAVNPEAAIGANCIINTAAVVEHDCIVGDHVHVCPGARLSGGVHVGEGAFIGAGAVIREGVRIGAWSVVGAGAVVLGNVAAKQRVAGVPARSIKR